MECGSARCPGLVIFSTIFFFLVKFISYVVAFLRCLSNSVVEVFLPTVLKCFHFRLQALFFSFSLDSVILFLFFLREYLSLFIFKSMSILKLLVGPMMNEVVYWN